MWRDFYPMETDTVHLTHSPPRYCRRCLELVVKSCSVREKGHCPSCRAHFQMFQPANDTKLDTAEPDGIKKQLLSLNKPPVPKGRCGMCRQQHELPPQMNGFCAKCDLGRTLALVYECSRCHKKQRIPHPMFSYQSSASAFGGPTWACHQGCCAYTTWRVVPEDVAKIPEAHRPASWGQEVWLQGIAEQSRGG